MKPRRKLTIKEQRFVKQVAITGNATEAAARVYNVKTRHGAGTLGAENMSKPVIREAVKELFKKEDITVEYVLKHQKDLLEGKVENHVKAKVAKDLGEYLGMYKDKLTSPPNGTARLPDNLASRLQRLRSQEGETEPVLPGEGHSGVRPPVRPASSKDM